jgi:hypothetical protein
MWSPSEFKEVGKAFLGLRHGAIWLRDTVILRCPKANSRIPIGEGETISALVAWSGIRVYLCPSVVNAAALLELAGG